jgi:pimeloyl-ACP methyl ester carboxylesterase
MAKHQFVLLPGLLNTRRLFQNQHEDLADIAEFPVVPELFHYKTIGEAAQAVLDAAPEQFCLGGFSMGGYVAFEIMRRAPGRVQRLALIDTRATPDTPEDTARRRGLIEQARLPGQFKGVQPSLLPGLIHPSQLDDTRITQPILDMAEEVGAEGFIRQQEAMIVRADSRPAMAAIRVPTVVIVGRQDMSTTLANAEEMATGIPDARLVVIEECGHMTVLERRAETSAALRRWLTE